MSYDLQLIPRIAGMEPGEIDAEYVESLEANAERPAEAAEVARMQALSAVLRAFNPGLKATGTAPPPGAVHPRRMIELNGEARGNGIQIVLDATGGGIAMPYWHTGEAARSAWREIWSYLQLLEEEGALWTWDPQLDRILSLDADFEDVLAVYQAGSHSTASLLAELAEAAPEPWWRFWKRGGKQG